MRKRREVDFLVCYLVLLVKAQRYRPQNRLAPERIGSKNEYYLDFIKKLTPLRHKISGSRLNISRLSFLFWWPWIQKTTNCFMLLIMWSLLKIMNLKRANNKSIILFASWNWSCLIVYVSYSLWLIVLFSFNLIRKIFWLSKIGHTCIILKYHVYPTLVRKITLRLQRNKNLNLEN